MATTVYVEGPAAIPEANPNATTNEVPQANLRLRNYVALSLIFIVFVLFVVGITVYVSIDVSNQSWEIVLDSLSISNLNITDNQISSDWGIGLNISNPGRRATNVLENLEYSVDWSGAPDQAIVSGKAKPVVQPPKNRTTLYLKGSTEWLTLHDTMSGDLMRRDIINSRSLTFDINFSVGITFKTQFRIDSGWDYKGLSFGDIKVPLLASNSTPNTLTGTYRNTLMGEYVYHRSYSY